MRALILLLTLCGIHSAFGRSEYWLAPRHDGKTGRGTESDPCDVSTTEKFDQFFTGLKPNTTVHLLPGVYTTRGGGAFKLPSGVKIFGSGRTKTLVRLAEYYQQNGGACVFHAKNYTLNYGNQIANLTVDCNYQQAWGKVTVRAVIFCGRSNVISNVSCIHAAGYGPECFALAICCDDPDSGNNLIQDCKVSEYTGGWCTAIFALNHWTAKFGENLRARYAVNCVIKNNAVYLHPAGGGCQAAYGCGDACNVTFRNNYSYQATSGFNFDTGRIRNLTIENNIFSECGGNGGGIGICTRTNEPGHFIAKATIAHNTISMAPQGNVAYGIDVEGSKSKPAKNVHILSNTIYNAAPLPSDWNVHSIRLWSVDGLAIESNRIESTITGQLLGRLANIIVSGNTDFSGKPAAGLTDTRRAYIQGRD